MDPWNIIDFDYPGVPTMISREETRYLYWLGAQYWKDIGHIVEIGPWLGGSTICLAAGMRNGAPVRKHRLHVFDNFVWRNFMASRSPLPLQDGDSFQSYFERNLASHGDLISTHRRILPDDPKPLDKLAESIHTPEDAGIPVLSWDSGEPVEILFVDGAKSWTGFKHLLHVFNDRLIPGKSLVVCQDYKFWGAYWVPMILEYFMEHFELAHNLRQNTVSFVFKSKIPVEKLDDLPGSGRIEISKGNELLEQASQRLLRCGDQLGANIVKACKVRYGINMGEKDLALSLFSRLEAEWPLGTDCQTLARLRNWLSAETGHYPSPTIRWRCVSIAQTIRRRMRWFMQRIFARLETPSG